MSTNYLITGGCGFLGSNLAAAALERGGRVTLLDSMSRVGSEQNLAWIRTKGEAALVRGDVRDLGTVMELVKSAPPDVVFHLAGQVAVTKSLENPYADFETNALGTVHVLEALRTHAPDAALIYASTNKVYGDLTRLEYAETPARYECPGFPDGFDESLPLDFHSPYGCSKGAADQYALDYARSYGLKTLVFRHSSMYGDRQFSTFDQGWIGWFCAQALDQKAGRLKEPFTIAGSGKQVRDILHIDDMVRLYFAGAERACAAKGEAFNIGGGRENSLSLLELFALLEKKLQTTLRYEKQEPRPGDQKVFFADLGKGKRLLDWSPKVGAEEGIERMLAWLRS